MKKTWIRVRQFPIHQFLWKHKTTLRLVFYNYLNSWFSFGLHYCWKCAGVHWASFAISNFRQLLALGISEALYFSKLDLLSPKNDLFWRKEMNCLLIHQSVVCKLDSIKIYNTRRLHYKFRWTPSARRVRLRSGQQKVRGLWPKSSSWFAPLGGLQKVLSFTYGWNCPFQQPFVCLMINDVLFWFVFLCKRSYNRGTRACSNIKYLQADQCTMG